MNYTESVKQMLESFERVPPDDRHREFAHLIQALGKGLGAAIGAIKGRKDMNVALESVLLAIRQTAIICHEIGDSSASDEERTVRVMSAEQYLRDIFNPEKMDG